MTDLRKGAVDGVKTYDLGHAAAELERLNVQAAVMAPITRRLFEEAGIGPGMRILDIGSGAGDVAILLATRGPAQGRNTFDAALAGAQLWLRGIRPMSAQSS
jgi:tRNA A58 N-methylase Trm61